MAPGIKFMVLADPRQTGIDALLRKIYEIYSDFALKNPFYSLEMPIRCELFDQNLKLALESTGYRLPWQQLPPLQIINTAHRRRTRQDEFT
ncbi:hypothetical protein DV515_00013397 [Chloebia gouldiae]|uniref:Trafficking protein particle complex subunit n=1 Tax=Chloebia gouldiae TaxID=44316 RepID=A0A3L8S1H4_CHLGU|nr:hypothetical protein DV515_00013397 [Chloebia gouldiae]